MRVRGLKHVITINSIICYKSHPMRVRGLKLGYIEKPQIAQRRTPCGCVD